jgi:hypothetical protein
MWLPGSDRYSHSDCYAAYQVFFPSRFADSRKHWVLGFALERNLAGWQVEVKAEGSGAHEVRTKRPCCPS